MTEYKGVKRSAERAAREALGSTLIDAAGTLGVALATEQAQRERVRAALRRADELIDAARSDGAALVESAEAAASKSASDYRQCWDECKAAGWRPAQLVAMGYPRPTVTAERTSRSTPTSASEPTQLRNGDVDASVGVSANTAAGGPADAGRPIHSA